MNKENWLYKIIACLILLSLSLSAQSKEDSSWIKKWNMKDEDTDKILLSPDGKIIRIPDPNKPTKQQDKVIDTSKPMTFDAFNYYETNRVDKTIVFLKSSLIPGYGFTSLAENNMGWIYFFIETGSLYLALKAENTKDAALPLLIYSVFRIYEFIDLSTSVDSYNQALRYQVRIKFNLE